MKGKKRALALLLAALLPGLCACQAGDGLPTSEASPEVTLPPASQSYVAPIGDAAVEQCITAYEAALHDLPRPDHRHIMLHCCMVSPAQLDRTA